MQSKHVVFFNTKGGVCKSTLCEYTSNGLQSLGRSVDVTNNDQQQHITLIQNDDAEFFLYDTAGAFTVKNIDLLKAAAEAEAVIIVPITTGKNDLKEFGFLLERLEEYGVKDKARFVFTKTRANSKALKERRQTLSEHGIESARYVMPHLEDFSEQRDTARTRNEISAFIHEVIL
ncbi:hypothetical protein JK628_23195 (plasmid) [Shewanella sp. KX20019]|uniref:nucleotide-binding protein n=1 Tax=Shewanella sp. KX20019 TaxID=2803864 RepID=UPI0019269572|nr:hypothetical protein [Shewanella sp. KX20019]QQX82690.1 hypothetical protein JK628_23195 [Shewanella sp. KX20019]